MRTGLTNGQEQPTTTGMGRKMMLAAMPGLMMIAGCVNVTAPDKPIVINLNINISQQVVLKLDSQAKQVIQGNPDIF